MQHFFAQRTSLPAVIPPEGRNSKPKNSVSEVIASFDDPIVRIDFDYNFEQRNKKPRYFGVCYKRNFPEMYSHYEWG